MELSHPPATPDELRERLDALYARFTFDFVAHAPYDHLHFGLWDDVPHQPDHLADAQQAYADAVVGLVPEGCRRVLDVGCGLGSIARQLAARGIEVTAISPRDDHIARLQAEPTAGVRFVCSRFDDLEPDATMDAVLFAESFNFVCPSAGGVAATLERCNGWLAERGHVVIADWLARDVLHALERSTQPTLVGQRDVSASVSYTFEVLQQRFERCARPYHELLLGVLDASDAELAAAVRTRLTEVPNGALRQLFAGSLADRDMANTRRYLLLLFERS